MKEQKKHKVRTLDRFPILYATTQNNLGNAYRTLAEGNKRQENCEKAITAYEEALRVFTAENFPDLHARVAQNLRGVREYCKGE